VGRIGAQVTVAKVLGLALVVVGILGFVPNPIVGEPAPADTPADEGAFFGTNVAHDLVHLLTGVVALAVGFGSGDPAKARAFNLTFGTVYAVVALLGFGLADLMRDLLAVNTPDNLLHLAIALLLVGVGLLAPTGPRPA
jgi:hypothetical protein